MTDSLTFEEIVSKEEWDTPCGCFWHKDDRGPAKWIVHQEAWCCFGPRVAFWCDDCLQEIMQYRGVISCDKCGTVHFGYSPKDSITLVEPIHKGAA